MNPLVIFIHGALSTARSWNYIQYATRKALKTLDAEVICPEYDVAEKPATEIIDDLLEQITPSLSYMPRRVIFVGHSFGGVLAVELARRLIEEHEVLAANVEVLTLSTPFGGSGAASFLKLFKPSSYFYNNTGAFDRFMTNFKNKPLPCRVASLITSIEGSGADFLRGENDGVVTVASQSQFNDDPLHEHCLMPTNHFEILLLPEAGAIISRLFLEVDLW